MGQRWNDPAALKPIISAIPDSDSYYFPATNGADAIKLAEKLATEKDIDPNNPKQCVGTIILIGYGPEWELMPHYE